MIIAAINEGDGENRAALSPSAVKQLTKMDLQVLCEQNLGVNAGFSDEQYKEAGADLLKDRKKILSQADVLISIEPPSPKQMEGLKKNALLIAPMDKDPESELVQWAMAQGISLFSMNLIPRTSRAQSMDSLSSQANLAGYRAVLEAVVNYHRAVPMMMTAAGMIHPAKILILGAGVAGLQAIATAKRLGAVVQAFDVRKAAKEQVESLGAEFIEVAIEDEDHETSGGYATEMSADYQKKQAQLIHQYASEADIVISTALIPGRLAPILLKKETIAAMKPGSVVVDMATSRGGNCELSSKDEVTNHHGVIILGYSNIAGFVPATATELYANNAVNLLKLIIKNGDVLSLDAEDDIVQCALLVHEGKFLPLQPSKAKEKASA